MGCLEEDIDYALSEIRRKTRVYVASSWRNEHQPVIVERLRELGFQVYDFRGCDTGWGTNNDRNGIPGGFHWSDVDPEWKTWNNIEYVDALTHPLCNVGIQSRYGCIATV